VELVDPANVLFLVTYADANQEFPEICQRIAETLNKGRKLKTVSLVIPQLPNMPEQSIIPREAFFAKGSVLTFEQSAGQVSKEQISFYPPGIPVIIPGEVITKEIIQYCRSMLAMGLPISGPVSEKLATIEVIKS
jgi:arginine/lysine/ornithine decarboxylase